MGGCSTPSSSRPSTIRTGASALIRAPTRSKSARTAARWQGTTWTLPTCCTGSSPRCNPEVTCALGSRLAPVPRRISSHRTRPGVRQRTAGPPEARSTLSVSRRTRHAVLPARCSEMLFADHPPPHFHARYSGDEAPVVIDTGKVFAGSLPNRALRLVRSGSKTTRRAGGKP